MRSSTAQSTPRSGLRRLRAVAYALSWLGVLALALTGFVNAYTHGHLFGWSLILHTAAAPLFMLGLAAYALLAAETHARRARLGGVAALNAVFFWSFLLAGAAAIATMFTAMLPTFGFTSQRWLLNSHWYAAAACVAAALLHAFTGLAAGRPKENRS